MLTLDDIRARGVDDLQKLLADLDARHRKMLLDAIATYGNVRDVPESVWTTIEDDLRNETAAALLLIVADADDWTADAIARQGVRTNGLTTAEMSAYTILTASHADEMAVDTTSALRNRLTRKVQDSQLTGPGDVGELTTAGIEQAIDDVLTTGRRAGIAIDETTSAISRGQLGARDRTNGSDGASTFDGQKVLVKLRWKVHPELSQSGPCWRCAPLDGKPEEVWSLVFPEGPGDDAHKGCVCTTEVYYVVVGASEDGFSESLRESVDDEGGHWITLDNGVHVKIDGAGKITDGPAALKGTDVDAKQTKGVRQKLNKLAAKKQPTSEPKGRSPADIKAELAKARQTLNTAKGFKAQNAARAKLQALNAELKANYGAGARPEYTRFKNAIDNETPGAYSDVKDGAASAELHNKTFGDWAANLDAGQKSAIQTYTGGAFSSINDGLRGHESLDDDSKATIKGLDAAFKSAATTAGDVVVYRGGGLSALGSDPTKMVGKTILDKGFVSTTTAVGIANGFAGQGKEKQRVVRYDISLPGGTKALSADAALGADSLGQHELILKRGSKFKIESVTPTKLKSGITFWHVKATLVK